MRELLEQRVCVVGRVEEIKDAFFSDTYIQLKDAGGSSVVIECAFDDESPFDWDIGDILVIEGQVDRELFFTYQMKRCRILGSM